MSVYLINYCKHDACESFPSCLFVFCGIKNISGVDQPVEILPVFPAYLL